jgi:hypothetical protein
VDESGRDLPVAPAGRQGRVTESIGGTPLPDPVTTIDRCIGQ